MLEEKAVVIKRREGSRWSRGAASAEGEKKSVWCLE
jgi:hypothetical protein